MRYQPNLSHAATVVGRTSGLLRPGISPVSNRNFQLLETAVTARKQSSRPRSNRNSYIQNFGAVFAIRRHPGSFRILARAAARAGEMCPGEGPKLASLFVARCDGGGCPPQYEGERRDSRGYGKVNRGAVDGETWGGAHRALAMLRLRGGNCHRLLRLQTRPAGRIRV